MGNIGKKEADNIIDQINNSWNIISLNLEEIFWKSLRTLYYWQIYVKEDVKINIHGSNSTIKEHA